MGLVPMQFNLPRVTTQMRITGRKKALMNGYTGRLQRVNLSNGKVSIMP